MKKYGKRFLFGAILLSIANLSYLAAQVPASLNPGGAPIMVFVTASGKNSSSDSLDQSKLTVTLDKQPVQVTSVRSAKSDNLLFAVVVDTSTSSAKNSVFIKEAAYNLFQGLSTGGNRGYLVFFDTTARSSKGPLQVPEALKALEEIRFGGATALFDTIAETTKVLSRGANPDTPRRVMLLLTDGDDNQSHIYLENAIASAQKEGVSIFALAVPHSGEKGEKILTEFIKNTGGQMIDNWKWEGGVKALLAAIDSQWVLSLAPLSTPDWKLHSFAVRSSEKGVQLSAPEKIALE